MRALARSPLWVVGVIGSLALNGCATVRPVTRSSQDDRAAAIVDGRFTGRDGDVVDGIPVFHTIAASLDEIGKIATTNRPRVIFIRNGRYHEKLTVRSPRVTLLGEDRDSTVITFDAASDTPNPAGGTYGTRGSYTLRINAPDFRAENLTIENAYAYAANAAKSDGDPAKFRNPQGVALMTDSASDRAVFVNVRLLGHQDTLFANAGRHYFYDCEIRGHVDFIFGAGRAVFEQCEIVSLDRGSRTNNGYVTAASTPDTAPFGFLIVRSRLKKESAAMAPASVTLGRPWHPFADAHSYPSVAFVDDWMDDHIGVKGWDRMSSVDSTGKRIWYEPASARFFESGSRGPGALPSASRPQLDGSQRKEWTSRNVLGGWMPDSARTPVVTADMIGEEHANGRSLEEMFAGRFPGVEVFRLPNGGITFRIRGQNTIYGSTDPLIIVDGVELTEGNGGLQFLSPDDIEKIEVLKDVGSTGIYGSKGANGVILITRKRAR